MESDDQYCAINDARKSNSAAAAVFKTSGLTQLGLLCLSYAELMKLRIVGMVLTTCSMGMLLAGGLAAWSSSFYVLSGTGLLAGGACVLNQYLERERDGLMERTKGRPLPRGKISGLHVSVLGMVMLLMGSVTLVAKVNGITAILGLISVFVYLCVYVPVKRCSWVCTPVGAVAGGIPPLMGWTSVSGKLEAGGWLLFFILFFWQHVHFYAIAWIYKEDYQRGGFPMLPVVDASGARTARQMMLAAAALLAVSQAGSASGLAGPAWGWGSLAAGAGLLIPVLLFWRFRSRAAARWVVLASIFYLPFLFGMIIADQL